MKLYIKYIKSFQNLIIGLKNKEVEETIKEGKVTVLKNDGEVIGLNVSMEEKDVPDTLNIDLEQTQNFIEKLVGKYLGDIKFEDQFVVGEIIETEDIEGTHLHKCKVNLGNDVQQIVCGAPNAKTGLKVIVATVGAWMPNGQQIIEGKLRGVDSLGMLCSAKELSIEEGIFNDEGIVELDSNYKVGDSFWKDFYR